MRYYLLAIRVWVIVWFTALINAGIAQASDVIMLRDGTQEIDGTILTINDAGIRITSNRGSNSSLITWDRIRSIKTESEDKLAQYQNLQAYAEDLWRARSRVERGDYVLAEPLFEKMYNRALGKTDESAYIIMEGLLRCRVARQDRVAAVIPWLECLRLQEAGVTRHAYLNMPEIIDSKTGLCGAIPPVWYVYQDNIELLNDELAAYVPANSLKVQHLAFLYWDSVKNVINNPPLKNAPDLQNTSATSQEESSTPSETDTENRREDAETNKLTLSEIGSQENLEPAGSGDEGILIVKAIVKADDSNTSSEDLEGSIKVLTRWARFPGWSGSWARFGRGMARSWMSDEEDLKQALVDLLYLPATRYTDPEDIEVKEYLAGFALKQAADVLDSLGRVNEAESLRIELVNKYKTHLLNKSRFRINASVTGEADS